MATFWTGWQLWEKMCFLLGCAIVLVICGGCVKLIVNHSRIRKYTTLEAEKAQIRQQMQRTASVNRGTGMEIPFGIRALESGIEVDGVWVSGSNTPASTTPGHSAPGSPTLSATTEGPKVISHEDPASDRASLPSQTSRIEIPQPAHGHEAGRLSVPITGQVKPTYRPRRSSGLRFSDSHNVEDGLGDRAAAFEALEGHSIGFRPADEVREAHRRSKSWATTSWNESHDPTGDSSQAASSRAVLHPPHHLSDRLGGFPNREKAPEPRRQSEMMMVQDTEGLSAVYMPSTSYAPMSYEDLPDERTYQSIPPPENDSSSSEASGPCMLPTNIGTTAEDADSDARYNGASQDAVNHLRRQTVDNNEDTKGNAPLENTTVRYPRGETITQPRRSQVIRKINSGFEILRPGTLGLARQDNEIVLGGISEAAKQGKKRESKRLHRRRGDSDLAKA